MVKTFTHPTTGQTVRLGRNRSQITRPQLRFRDYFKAEALPPAPDCNYATAAARALSEMYGNDQLGDCVIACNGHVFGVFNENAGAMPSIFSEEEIIQSYSLIGGYVPGDPATDNGCDILTGLGILKGHGMKGHHDPSGTIEPVMHHVQGWLAVDGANQAEVRQAVYLGENLIFGIELPDTWISPFPSSSGFTWGVAGPSDPQNGHCVAGVGSDVNGIQIATWGMVGTMSYAAIAAYTAGSDGGELYVAFSKESLVRAQLKTPAGFDFTQLVTDIEGLQ